MVMLRQIIQTEKKYERNKKYNVARFNTNQREKYLQNVEISGHQIKALIDIGNKDIRLMREDRYHMIEAPILINRPIKFYGIGKGNEILGKTS